jgi:hypothetical protein
MLSLFRETKQAEPEPLHPVPPEKSTRLREELDAAVTSKDQVAASLANAQQDLAETQASFDRETQAFALGKLRSEPNPARLHDAIARVDALRRSHLAAVNSVARLQPQVSNAELEERTETERHELQQMVCRAESKFAEFEAAISAAQQIENVLFDALFERTTGLRRAFATPEIQTEANQLRRSLCDRVVVLAQTSRHAVHPRFSTDGEVYLGPGLAYLRSDAAALRRSA